MMDEVEEEGEDGKRLNRKEQLCSGLSTSEIDHYW